MPAHVRVDGIWVDTVFPTGDLKFSNQWKTDDYCGDVLASVTLAAPKTFESPFTLPGRRFQVVSPLGVPLFGGLTIEPERSDQGITLHARGLGSDLARWPAVYDADSSSGEDLQPTTVPNAALDWAISRGAPFIRGADLGSSPIVPVADEDLSTLAKLLIRAAILQGKRVVVDPAGEVTFEADPTSPTWIMNPGTGYMGTADEAYVSTLFGQYQYTAAGTITITIFGSPTGGTFTLTGNGLTTATLAYNVSTSSLQTAIRGLGGVFAGALVTGTAGVRYVARIPSAAGALLTAASSLTGGTSPGVTAETSSVIGIAEAQDDEAVEQFGFSSRTIDLTPLGPISSTTAQSYIAGRLALVGGRMGYTDALDVDDTNMRHITGGWATARWVRSGTMLRVPGVTDSRSNPTTRASQDVILGEVEVTEATYPAATVAPVGFTPRDFEGALAAPENQTETDVA